MGQERLDSKSLPENTDTGNASVEAEGRLRSAPVLGRSNIQKSTGPENLNARRPNGNCCARGRAHSSASTEAILTRSEAHCVAAQNVYSGLMRYWSVFCWFSVVLLHFSPAWAGTLAQFRTVFGDIEVELYDQQKPVTVENFKRLVQSGAYESTFFHRVVPGFVAQGGGYFSFNPATTNLFGWPWSNLGVVPNFGQITNEFSVGPFYSNTKGTIAMAKLGSGPNTATCEWFFNLANNSANLD